MQVLKLARRAWEGQGVTGAIVAGSLVAAGVFLGVMLAAGPRPSPLTDPVPLACSGGTNVGTVDHMGDDPGEEDPRKMATRWAHHQPADSVVWDDDLEIREERGRDLARVAWLDDSGRANARLTFSRTSGGGWLIDTIESC